MLNMNLFRILADVSHTVSKCILIWAIHYNQSAEGVSLITQSLYIAVFVTRYINLFWVPPSASYWNFVLKNFYIGSSIYIIFIMMRVFPRTREREKAWKFGGLCAGGSLVAAPLVTLIFRGSNDTDIVWILDSFSLILESVCVLPQLLLLRQTTVPTVIDSFYLLTLGSYRAFYILNWIIRGVSKEHHIDWIQIIFGAIQTALYLDFAWVYWTRQRVKLRGGGVVDSDDMSKGWLVNRFLGAATTNRESFDEEEATVDPRDRPGSNDQRRSSVETRKPTHRWGARGVSVSADDTLDEHERRTRPRVRDPDFDGTDDELEGMLENDRPQGTPAGGDSSKDSGGTSNRAVLNSGDEWQEPRQGQ